MSSEVTRSIAAPADQVWDVLADGWTYAAWLVGASHIRAVDAGWPAPDTKIHHSVGSWPLVIQDDTKVLSCEPGQFLELEARVYPAGAAHVRFHLTSLGPARTELRMTEELHRGPAQHLPKVAQSLLLTPRNKESLARLASYVEGRVRTGRQPTP
ncbi:Polyketide cyclase / dehydrase and lipid transport [Actinopolymorpha cephalotaxi]|uniref:Polyketide cyclase / dehydrase and lipid transport n=1 Tax=Actinopolymorpha cephalotaxi TaxID=504797 RepID=A0A1I2KCT4_9ACTN|nr:SRPBCC family protein [Actinopolymorpha cephalotaxi]NYH84332.1 uncharacterized protein YndB with AHSA1/START domain [Actinopolymorpha cephalotaxi]SFF63027.1 Polyketide cyclase / dehydrase and lipid transport [Actinopolymorpha cephalotaxi]